MSAARFRITYTSPAELARALDDEIARGGLLVRVAPPETLAFRDAVVLELVAGGSLSLDLEVLSLLPGTGVVVALGPEHAEKVRALHRAMPAGGGAAVHEIPSDDDDGSAPRAGVTSAMAEKIRLARHGTREDRNALLRDPNRTLHALVIKCPQVTIDEVAAWAKNAQLGADFLRQIAERSDWLARPNVAQGLVRNPKTPAEVALRALDHVGAEALRQMAKGAGVPPHVAAAARKKTIARK